MHRTLVVLLLVFTVLVATACTSGDGATPGQAPGTAAATDDDDGDAIAVTPEAQLEGTCEPLPRKDDDGLHLRAELVVRNTGNTGVVVRVIATWIQPGGQRLTASQRARLEVGESKPVDLRIDIAPREARGVRRMVERDRPCVTRVRIAGAFGAPEQ